MEELIKELDKYNHYSFTYNLKDIKDILINKSFLSEIIDIANKKISKSIVNKTNKVIYAIILKNNILYKKPIKFINNTFYSDIHNKTKINFIKNIMLEVESNRNLEIYDFSVQFFIFPKERKKERKKFYKLFKLIGQIDDITEKRYKKYFFKNSITHFLIDSYNIMNRHYLLIFLLILSISFFTHKSQLILLGFPSNIISNIQILSISSLYSIFYIPIILFFSLIIMVYLYNLLNTLPKRQTYDFFKIIVATLVYLSTIFSSYNLYFISQENIKVNNSFLIKYFYEGYYPRFATKKNRFLNKISDKKLILLLERNGNIIYYYKLEDLAINKELYKTICSENSFEKKIISLLKYSNYSNTKSIKIINNISELDILDKNTSLTLFKDKYCM